MRYRFLRAYTGAFRHFDLVHGDELGLGSEYHMLSMLPEPSNFERFVTLSAILGASTLTR
jgi:hypothetical protein